MFSIKKVAGLSVVLGLVMAGAVSVPAQAADKILTVWADETRSKNLKSAIGELKDQKVGEFVPNYKIKVVGYSNFDALKAAIDNSTVTSGPDIVLGANDWVPTLAKNGKLAPFQLSSSAAANFTQNQLGDLSHGGKLYGVPLDINNVALLTNGKLTTVPTSFGEMVAYYKANKTSKGLTRGLCVAGGGMSFGAAGVLAALGGAPYAMKNGRAQTTGEPFSVSNFATHVRNNLLDASGKPNGFFTDSDANCKTDFMAGKVPYAVIGNWEWKDYEAKGFNMGKLSCIPGIKKGSCGAGFGSVSGALLTSFAYLGGDEAAAKSFLNNYFGSAKGASDYQKYEQRPPANKAAAAISAAALKGFGNSAAKASIPQLGTFLNGGVKDTTGNVLGGAKGASIPAFWDALPALWTRLLSSNDKLRKDPGDSARLFSKIMKANAANAAK